MDFCLLDNPGMGHDSNSDAAPLARELSDEEIICTWMEPKPTKGPLDFRPWRLLSPAGWWKAHEFMEWYPIGLALDTLWEVEERLTLPRWKPYVEQLLQWQSLEKVYVEQLFYLLHATPEQKIKALAAMLRPIVVSAQADQGESPAAPAPQIVQ